MPARTGEEFLRGLKDDRQVWVGDDRVSDVADHPAFAGAARFVAALFDLQHEAADGLPDARPRDGRADQREPPDPAIARRTSSAGTPAWSGSPSARVGLMGARPTT